MPRSPGGGCGARPGRIAVPPGAGPPRAGGLSLAAGTGALMWAPHLVIHGVPVSPPSGRARGNVTAGLFVRRRDHRHGRAPWPGPHRGPAGRPAGPHATGARAGPSVGEYGSAALCLISSAGHPIPWGPVAGSPAPVARLFGETVRIRVAVARHPEVPAGWNVAGAAIGHPKVLTGPTGGCQRIRPSWRARAAVSVRLAAPSLPRTGSRAF